MEERESQIEEEIKDLKQELENFKKEKERVRAIVGKIGGIPTFNTRIFNIIFVVLVLACLVISLIFGGTIRLVVLEVAIAAVSMKLIYLINKQARTNHFQVWILSSLEWRLDEIMRKINTNKREV